MTRLITALVLSPLTGCALFAQSFEVASIKPAAPMANGRMMIGMRGGPGTPDPGHMSFTNVSLKDLMQTAWDVKGYQISGPSWLESIRFDIEAKLPATATKPESRLMLQHFLADRFHLVLHHSTTESSMYALLVAKKGSKLKPSADTPDDASDKAGSVPRAGKDGMPAPQKGATMMMMAPGGKLKLVANGTTLDRFADVLANQLDRPVTDMTGLTGTYDIILEFAPDPAIMQARMAAMGVAPPPGMQPEHDAQDPSATATIFTALPDQLGLRLEARKGPVDLLVVDSVEKTPTEN